SHRADGIAGFAHARARGSQGRAGAAGRPESRPLGSLVDPARTGRHRTRTETRRRAGAVPAPGDDGRLPRARAGHGANRLGTDRAVVRAARRDRALTRGGPQPRGGGGDGGGSRARAATGGCAGAGIRDGELPLAAERARRPAQQAGPRLGGARGIRTRGVAGAERTRTHAFAETRRRVRIGISRNQCARRAMPPAVSTAAAAFTCKVPSLVRLLCTSRSCSPRASNFGATDNSNAAMPLTCAAAIEEPELKS